MNIISLFWGIIVGIEAYWFLWLQLSGALNWIFKHHKSQKFMHTFARACCRIGMSTNVCPSVRVPTCSGGLCDIKWGGREMNHQRINRMSARSPTWVWFSKTLNIVSVYLNPGGEILRITCYVSAVQTNPLGEVPNSCCSGNPGKHLESPKYTI